MIQPVVELLTMLHAVAHQILSRLKGSPALRRFVAVQQRLVPFPLPLFRWLANTRYIATAFYPYGYAIFRTCYDRDKLGYWESRQSLYWHFLNESKIDRKTLGAAPELSGTVLEIGAGLGKQIDYLRSRGTRLRNTLP